jgi:hypothetical protein|tara:strand:- start:1619 stop:2626 length:1008 start_codon:yes stop_codon:yes gene_type:complete
MSPSALAHARARPTASLSRPSPASLASRATPIVRAGKFSRLSTSGDDDDDDEDAATPSVSVSVSRPRDDDELPDNLFDAVGKAARATNDAIARGTAGSIVELLIPELWDPISGNVMSESGDQLKVWEISREFAQRLSEGGRRVRAVYPDAGAAAMLRARWGDAATFDVASVDDRNLVDEDFDGVVVFAAPDPISLEKVQRTTGRANELGCPVVLLNPRLASGDAGVGLNVRRMRERFLGKMTVTYSLRPLPWCNGSLFKAYPGAWKLFLEDPEEPGRFNLVDEYAQRPAGEELDDIVTAALRPKGEDGEAVEKTTAEKVFGFVREMQRFAKSLSN